MLQRWGMVVAAGALCVTGGTLAPQAVAQSGGSYDDAAAYCQAYGNVDKPGSRYTGAKVPRWMQRAVNATPPYAALEWRCMDGRVYACLDSGGSAHCGKPALSRTPSPGLHEFCRQNPSASSMPMAVTGSLTPYEWACRGRVPMIRKHYPVDARGFMVGQYEDVTRFAPVARQNTSQPPHLTTITYDGLSGSGCSLFLDRKRKRFVGGVNYEDGVWYLGIDGQTFQFKEGRGGSATRTMRSRDGQISVVITIGHEVWSSNDANVPASLRAASVRIIKDGRTSTINAYQFCADG